MIVSSVRKHKVARADTILKARNYNNFSNNAALIELFQNKF